jgi:hypothetical protein
MISSVVGIGPRLSCSPRQRELYCLFAVRAGQPADCDASRINEDVAEGRRRLSRCAHAHATLALQAGIHPKDVSERPGHATVPITLDTYSQPIPAMQQEAAVLIAQLVFSQA